MDDKKKARLVAALEREGILQQLQPELTWQRLLAIWWFIFWRYCLGLLAIFSILDLVWRKFFGGGFFLSNVLTDGKAIVALVICFGLALAWGVVVIHMALTKHYKLTGVRLLMLAR